MVKKQPEKFLFVFNSKSSGINCEVFAKDMFEAQEKICRVLGITQINAPVFMTENFECPRCRCQSTECNYPS